MSALTLSASTATLAEVRRRVLEFRQELIALCDADPHPARVLQLNVQLFPLSRDIPPRSGETAFTPTPARAPARRTSSATSQKD